MKQMKRYPGCFVCGDKNPIGLNVAFYSDDERVVADYTAGRQFEGYKDVLHGGILSALLDEASSSNPDAVILIAFDETKTIIPQAASRNFDEYVL